VTRLAALAALVVALAAAAIGSAAAPAKLFPLADGNFWTLRERGSGVPSTTTVQERGGAFLLRGFPGAGTLRVRVAGLGVEAWDPGDHRWEPFLRLGARAGTRYVVDLSNKLFWRAIEVRIASRRAVVRGYRGRVLRGCTLLTFSYRQPIADAGLEELAFAPGIGLVKASEQSIEGPRVSTLASFRVE
jgi:hypothetical protein